MKRVFLAIVMMLLLGFSAAQDMKKASVFITHTDFMEMIDTYCDVDFGSDSATVYLFIGDSIHSETYAIAERTDIGVVMRDSTFIEFERGMDSHMARTPCEIFLKSGFFDYCDIKEIAIFIW